MPVLSTPRISLFYREQGSADGLPIVFLHGNFATSRWWMPLWELLPPEIRCLAPDLRGCGSSDKPAAGYTIEELAADVSAFADSVGLRSFDLVGHGSGGALAVELALNHPDRVRSLVLVNSAPVEGVDTPLEALALLGRMRTEPDLLRKGMSALLPLLSATDDPQFETLLRDAESMAPAAFTEVAVALGQWNRFAAARNLTLPTLIVWSDEDPMTTRDAMTRTLIAIPGANNMEVLHGVGHSPMLEAPLALAERMVDFWNEDYDVLANLRADGMAEFGADES
jgi:branched-chain amino acid transport system permease protein